MTRLWKWTIAGEFVSLAMNLLILLSSMSNIFKESNEASLYGIWAVFGFTGAARSILAVYAYNFFPRRGLVPKGVRKLFVGFRVLGTFHWLLILIVFVVGLINLLEPDTPFKRAFSKILLYYGAALVLHTLLMIQQYRFFYYVRNNEKQRINRLINELGE